MGGRTSKHHCGRWPTQPPWLRTLSQSARTRHRGRRWRSGSRSSSRPLRKTCRSGWPGATRRWGWVGLRVGDARISMCAQAVREPKQLRVCLGRRCGCGGAFTGSRCWQAVWAVLNAGEDGLSPGTSWKLRSSGKFDTPCDRMQRVKFSVARRAWSWFGFVRPPELDELSEPEPHAAIAVTTAIVAAVRAGVTHPRRGGGMTRVRWFSMPQPGSTRPC